MTIRTCDPPYGNKAKSKTRRAVLPEPLFEHLTNLRTLYERDQADIPTLLAHGQTETVAQLEARWATIRAAVEADIRALHAFQRHALRQASKEERRQAAKARDTFVYAIENQETGAVKIGISSGPDGRLISLQTATHARLRLLGTIRGDEETEAELHLRFDTDHIGGEWFNCSTELATWIATLGRPDLEPTPPTDEDGISHRTTPETGGGTLPKCRTSCVHEAQP